MNSGMNRVTLFGNIGADPELRTTKDNVALLRFRLATSESWIDKETKEREERTEWHDVVVFGPRAEGLARVLKKGEPLLIEGSLRTTTVEKDGVRKWYTDVVVRDVFFTGRPRKAEEPAQSLIARAAVLREADLPF